MFSADSIRRLTRAYVTLRGMALTAPVLLAFQIIAASRLLGFSPVVTDVAVWGGLVTTLMLALMYRRRYGVVMAERSEIWSHHVRDWLLGLAAITLAVAAAIFGGVLAGLTLYQVGLVLGGAGIVFTGASIGGYHRSWLVPAFALGVLTITFAVPGLADFRGMSHLALAGSSVWAWTLEHRRFTRRLANAC
jgi:hypothetical protein